MALISIILGLLLDRHWKELTRYRQFGWFSNFSQFVFDKTDDYLHNPTARFLAVLAPPVLAIIVIQDLTASFITPVSFLFAFVIFVYCLGSLEIEQTLEQIIAALNDKDNEKARSLLAEINPQETVTDDELVDLSLQSTMDIVIERLFGVIFWFAILGPVGAVIYRLSQILLNNFASDPVFSKNAERMVDLLNWLPKRFLAISFAITGHFEGSLAAYHENKETDRNQQYLLIDVCHGSLEGNDKDDKAAYLSAFRGLILRSLIVWLTSIALLTLLGWH